MLKYPVVYVVWKDHAESAVAGWSDVSKLDANKLALAQTIGFLVHEDKESIQISTTYLDEYDICGRPDIIAKALIVFRQELDVDEYKPPVKKSRTKKV